MGIFDNTELVNALVHLVKSPRVQYLGNQLVGKAGMGAQPLRLPSNTSRRPGASSRTGSASNAGAGIGRSLGGLASLLSRGGQPQQQQSDPMMDLYAQLLNQLQQPVRMPTGIDEANLMSQVKKAINPIYDERISAARGQEQRASKDVTGMYRALSNDYERLAPEQVKQAAAAKQEVEALYGQLRSNIEGNFSRVSEEQSELFKSLGIEDALPDVMADQEAPVQDALVAASQNQAQQQQRYMDMGQADATYYREGSPLATMQGNEINVDLLNQLNDYVNQANAERSAGIQSGYLDQLGQAQNQLAQQQQAAQSEQGRRQGMLFEMLQSQMSAKSQPTELNVDTFMAQLPPQTQQSVAGAFTRLQRSPEAIYGKVEDKRSPVPGTYVETTPNWYMAQAQKMLENGEIDPVTYQALQQYMQLYFNMGSR